MNYRSTLVLLIVVAAVGYFAFWVDKPPADKDVKELLFPGINEERVDRLSVTRPGGKLVLERAEGRWRLREPLDAPADPDEARSFLRSLLSLRSVKEVPEGDASRYGLAPAALSISIEGKNLARTLKIGRETPWPGGVYARAEGGASPPPSSIVAIEDDLAETAKRPPERFRMREVFTLTESDVTGFEILPGGREADAVAAQREKDAWTLTRPHRALGGDPEISSCFSDWKQIRVEKFSDDAPTPEKLSQYGLADGAKELFAALRFTRTGKDPLEVRVGAKAPGAETFGDPERYLRLSDEPFVYTARLADGKILKNLEALRADRILPLEGKKPTEIQIERKLDVLHLKKQGEQWMFLAAEGRPTRRADDIQVAKWLARITELSFRDFAKGQKEADKKFEPLLPLTDAARKKWGLTDPEAAVTLVHKDGSEKLFIGKTEQGRTLVSREGEGIALWVKPEAGEAARIRYIDLRDRAMTDLWAEGAYSLELRRKGQDALSFAKQGAKWVLAGDAKQEDRPAARDVSRKLAKLEAARIAESDSVDWAKYGLADPEASLRGFYAPPEGQEGDASCTLLLGNPADGGGRYARIEEDRFNHLFVLSQNTIDKILIDLAKSPSQ